MPKDQKIEKRYIVQRKDGRFISGGDRILMRAAAVSEEMRAQGITFRDVAFTAVEMEVSFRKAIEVFHRFGEHIITGTVEELEKFGLDMVGLIFQMNAPKYRRKWLIILVVTMILLTVGIGMIY